MADPSQKTGRKRTAGKSESGSSTQTFRFIPLADDLSVNLGYSVSVFQGVVLAVRFAGHRKHLACGLRARANGGIDLLAPLVLPGELNST
ncbi:MAG: hypothetical protein PHS32_04975 [Rhodoferax sp.]|uniref:hypothetical protein n=1 Tax=Rhodoferax sp. TaxID=50421 RepID=UPI00262F0E0E|nr:hypothetical protein [Rhodoferax sp.]MDD5333081.1 hypothetical protein [Rhodoferax sp.]